MFSFIESDRGVTNLLVGLDFSDARYDPMPGGDAFSICLQIYNYVLLMCNYLICFRNIGAEVAQAV
jgi:hypothetical protein